MVPSCLAWQSADCRSAAVQRAAINLGGKPQWVDCVTGLRRNILNPVFSTAAFWNPYLTLEPGEVTADEFAAQAEGLRRDYTVRADSIRCELAGRELTAGRPVIEFPFSCGERFSLLIEYEPDVGGCSRNLSLVDALAGKKSEMGWWDLARWHPYCLRPEELECLLAVCSRGDRRWESQELPVLLLCQFVGLSDADA